MKSNTLVLVGLLAVVFFIGYFAPLLGLNTCSYNAKGSCVGLEPIGLSVPDFGGWRVIFAPALPFIWAFQAMGNFFQIITFQIDGFPSILVVLLFYPLSFFVIFTIIKIVRGTGD